MSINKGNYNKRTLKAHPKISFKKENVLKNSIYIKNNNKILRACDTLSNDTPNTGKCKLFVLHFPFFH